MNQVKWLDEYCHTCGAQINSFDKRCSATLAYKNPHCEACIANEYDLDVQAFRAYLEDFFGMRPCLGI